MLVVPFEGRLDWRKPPVVTLLLIVANCWIYFAGVSANRADTQQAYQAYVNGQLIEWEVSAYRAYIGSRPQAELPADDRALVVQIVFDLGFDHHVRSLDDFAADPQWQHRRAGFETVRNRVTSVRWGLIPAQRQPLTIITSMFLHGSAGHLIGNMAFLFLFGFALERVLGSTRYLGAYILGGCGGSLLHVALFSDSHVPTIGASGAVSALMGAYLAVYQLRRIRFFYNIGFYFGEFRAPALIVLPFWIAKEFYGWVSGDTNIAYAVHIGGLAAGAVLAFALTRLGRVSDAAYLDAAQTALDRSTERQKLEGLIEAFKFDQAKAQAQRLLDDDPHDAGVWSQLLAVVGTKTADIAYHDTVGRLFALAPTAAAQAEMALLIEDTYSRYASGSHPKPALRNVGLLVGLGRFFAMRQNLQSAQRITDVLLTADRREPEFARLLSQLSSALHKAGAVKQAQHYRRELASRFPAGRRLGVKEVTNGGSVEPSDRGLSKNRSTAVRLRDG